MAAFTTIIAAIGALAAVGGAGYSIYSGEKQREKLEGQEREAKERAAAQEAAFNAEKAESERQKGLIRTRDQQAMRYKVAALGQQGRAGTVLTGPSGLSSPTPTTGGGKTILGA